MKKQSSASVLIYVLMILSTITMLLQHMMQGILINTAFAQAMVNRERAVMLAKSGLNVALAQLALLKPEEQKKDDAKKESEQPPTEKKDDKDIKEAKPIKKFFERVYPYLNRWQTFVLTEKIDGFDGQIKVCLTCEHGKININEAFDFAKMEFKKPFGDLLKGLEIPGKMPAGQLLAKLTNFLKQRKRKLDDLSELSSIPELKPLDIFYTPPQPALGPGKKTQPSPMLALLDIFTIWSGKNELDLLFLSDALCAILGLRRPLADDPEKRHEKNTLFAQKFDPKLAQNWDDNWAAIEPMYDQKPKIFSEIKGIFTKEFGPTDFSVLCCGKVGNVEQRLMAWISIGENLEEEIDDKKQDEKEAPKEGQDEQKQKAAKLEQKGEKMWFKINKIYWL